jgi:hypothetical protein
MESTPPGAAIVRADNGFVLGWTPETVEFRRSPEPVMIRFVLEGYSPVYREVPVASDGELKVELKAIPRKRAPATKKSKGSKEHGASARPIPTSP